MGVIVTPMAPPPLQDVSTANFGIQDQVLNTSPLASVEQDINLIPLRNDGYVEAVGTTATRSEATGE